MLFLYSPADGFAAYVQFTSPCGRGAHLLQRHLNRYLAYPAHQQSWFVCKDLRSIRSSCYHFVPVHGARLEVFVGDKVIHSSKDTPGFYARAWLDAHQDLGFQTRLVITQPEQVLSVDVADFRDWRQTELMIEHLPKTHVKIFIDDYYYE